MGIKPRVIRSVGKYITNVAFEALDKERLKLIIINA